MLRILQVVLALTCMTTYATAGTDVLGTASARGSMRVDGYNVQGVSTVFNGSVVETQDASAVLRVAHGVDIVLSKGSRGTVYSNRFVLQSGEAELAATGSFALEANGLHVTANKPNSEGIVAVTPKGAVEVTAFNGSFGVRDDQGLLLSNVLPGRGLSFALQSSAIPQAGATPYNVTVVGMLHFENGHYFVTDSHNIRYEISGTNPQEYVGYKVVVSGTLQPVSQATPQPGQMAGIIAVKTIEINGAIEATGAAWVITGTALGGAGTVGYVVYNAVNPPASR